MRLGTRSARLLATISPLALTLALAAPATARTVIQPEIDVAQIIASITTQTAGNSANIINSSLAVVNSAVDASVDSGTGSLDSINNVEDSNTSIDFEDNTIFAIARGTDGLNQIGTLDTAAAGPIDGAAVFNGGFTDTVDLNASVTNSALTANVEGSGGANLDTDFDGNLILAEGSFNRGTSTIEATVPASSELGDPIFGAGYIEPASNLSGGFTGTLVTAATLNVVNQQVNRDFQSSDGDTALVSGNEISLLRDVDDGVPLGGAYGVTNNAISAQGNGNVSDNSIFVREEIETDSGTETGSLLFEGNGAVANWQLSANDIGGAISAENSGSLIQGVFTFAFFGGGAITSGENLSIDLSNNTVESSARLNAARNEITIDGGMQLSGQFGWDSLAVAGHDQIVDLDESVVGTGSEVFVAADFYTVNRQFIVSDGLFQVVDALTEDAVIRLGIEDMDANGSVTNDDNAISASALGNSGQNIIGNNTADAAEGTSPEVDTVLASLNSQFAEALDASSEVTNSIIRTDIGYGEPIAGINGFGGFEGSSLSMSGNAIGASSTANAGTSSVSLDANTIDNSYDSDDDATNSVQNSGAFLSANRGNVFSSDEDFEASAGTTVVNSQRVLGGDGPSTVDALLSDNTIQLFVNAHPGDSNNPEADPSDATTTDSIAGSAFDVSGNSMQAAASGNVFNSLISHDAATTYTGSAGTLSQQSLADTEVTAEIVDNTLDVDLAVGIDLAGPISDVSVRVDENQMVARGTGNQATTTTVVEATSFVGGAWTGLYDPLDPATSAAGAIQASTDANELSVGYATLNASLGALTDQLLVDSTVSSISDDSDIEVDVVEEANVDETVLDIAGAISVAGNTLGSQSRGNEAANLVLLDAASTASSATGDNTVVPDLPEYGPLAGIVANQAVTGDSSVSALTQDNDVDIDTGGLLTGSLDASGNRVIANAIANLATNEVSVSALTLDVGPTTPDIVSSYIQDNGNAADDLFVDSSVFILNNQRNEGEDPESGARGATVTATVEDDSEIDVDTDNLTSSSVSVDGNL
ncbi:MAG: hypothetical protein WD489_04960, partial [Rhodovibrionaceae bacterium]